MKVTVSQELNKVIVSSSGPQGAKGDKGEKGDPHGTSGTSGTSGSSGSSGKDGSGGSSGTSGKNGSSGTRGTSGSSGSSGTRGSWGTSGSSGTRGTSGSSGSSGSSGTSADFASVAISETAPDTGTSGKLWFDSNEGTLYIQYEDANGTNWIPSNQLVGSDGTSGTDGTSAQYASVAISETAPVTGTQGKLWFDSNEGTLYIQYEDANGTNWIPSNDLMGSDGTSGTEGTSGTSGSSGTSGTSGSSGSSGSSGTSGKNGTSGTSGLSDKYASVSFTSYGLGTNGTIIAEPNLGYTTAQTFILAYDAGNYQICNVLSYTKATGELVFGQVRTFGSGTYNDWKINLAGASGGNGTNGTAGSGGTAGTSGTSGTSGLVGPDGHLAKWVYSSNVTMEDPLLGYFRFSSDWQNGGGISRMVIDDIAHSPQSNFSDVLNAFTLNTVVKFIKVDDPTVFKILRLTALNPNEAGYELYDVTQISGNGVAVTGDVFAVGMLGPSGTSGTSGLLALNGQRNNGVITLSGSAPNGTVNDNLMFNGSKLELTGSQVISNTLNVLGGAYVSTSLDIVASVKVTGSLTVSGSSTFTNIGPAIFSGSVVMNDTLVVSGFDLGNSNKQIISYTSSLNAYTQSVKNEVANIQAYTASVKETISQTLTYTSSLNAYTQSVKNEVANIQAYTASVKETISQTLTYTSSLNAYTQSVKNEVANIQAYTSSVKEEISQIVTYTSSLNAYTQSVKFEVATIQAYTASVKEENSQLFSYTSSLNAYTQSVKNEVANIQAYTSSVKEEISQIVSYTSSLNAYTQSVKNEVVGIQAYTASVKESISQTLAYTQSAKYEIAQIQAYTASVKENISQTLAYTASVKNEVVNIQSYTASLKNAIVVNGSDVEVLGNFRAQQIHTTYVTSSVLLQSGSTKFGDTLDDRHESTGSVLITGSFIVNGFDLGDTNNQIVAYTASVKNEVANIQAYTASVKYELGQVFAYTASVKEEIAQIVSYTASLNAYTQSVKNEVVGIQAYTSSVKEETSQLFTYTSSLNSYTQSVKNEVVGIQAYTHSLKSVGLVSGSQQIIDYNIFATTGSNTFYDNQTIVGNLTFPSNSFISTTNDSGGLLISALNQGTLHLNADGGEGDVFVGRTGWNGRLKVRGNAELTGSLYLDRVIWNYISQTFTAIPVTYGETGITFTVLPDNTITDMSVAYGAGGYGPVSVNLTIPGTTFPGGTTPANDIVFNIQTFESPGPVYSTDPTSAISYVSGTPPQRYDNIASNGIVGIGAGNKHWTFDTSGSFNTPGNINISGSLIVVSGGITGSLLSTNGIVSSSQQILNYSLFALTASNNTFYGENRFENKVTHTNGYIVLTQVSQSLNFSDDEAAAIGGVPLGGLYRNGNFIAIRIV